MNAIVEYVQNLIHHQSTEENQLRLGLGVSRAFLARRSALSFRLNGKGSTVDTESRWVWKSHKEPIYILPAKEPNTHMVISGMSGFGKSTLLKSLLLDIGSCNIPVILFDAHNEHEEAIKALKGKVFDPSYSSVNIFDTGLESVSVRISELTNMFKSIYSLGYVQADKLSRCMWYMYKKAQRNGKIPNITDLLNELELFINRSKSASERSTLMHLKGRMALLRSSTLSGSFIDFRELTRGISSFSLGLIKSDVIRVIYIQELLRRLYQEMKTASKERGVRLYIVVDEAQFLISNSGSGSYLISQLIEEGRKYGVGVILATHAASDLNKQIIANASVFAAFYPREPSDVNYVSNILAGSMPDKAFAVKQMLHKLKPNEIIMVSRAHKEPVVVKTAGAMEVAASVEAAPYLSHDEKEQRVRGLPKRPMTLEQLTKQIGPVTEEDLENLGIEELDLQWNDKDERWFMRSGNPGIEHEVYVMKISERLSEMGFDNYIMDNASNPDVAAFGNNKRVAVEYETGSKIKDETFKMLNERRTGYNKVVVLVNDAYAGDYIKNFSNDKVHVFAINRFDNAMAYIKSILS